MPDTRTIRAVRLYTDDFGKWAFETVTVPMLLKEFAPPAAPMHVPDAQAAQQYVAIELPVGWGGTEPHPTPMFCLAGEFRVTY